MRTREDRVNALRTRARERGLDDQHLERLHEDAGVTAVVDWLEDHNFWDLAWEWKVWR